MARLEEIAHDMSCQVGSESVREGWEVGSRVLDWMTARVELPFPKTRKDTGGAGLGRQSEVEFWGLMFEIFIEQPGRIGN